MYVHVERRVTPGRSLEQLYVSVSISVSVAMSVSVFTRGSVRVFVCVCCVLHFQAGLGVCLSPCLCLCLCVRLCQRLIGNFFLFPPPFFSIVSINPKV